MVVLDSNVWISALEFGGIPDKALYQALTRDRLAISDFIQSEIQRVLTGKFGRDPLEAQALLSELLVEALVVEVTGRVKGFCRDPKDDAILETAWKSGAHVLVAGDKDLLSIGEFRGTALISPSEYVKKL